MTGPRVFVKCFRTVTRHGRPAVTFDWHPRSGSFPTVAAAVDACETGVCAGHAHEVRVA